MSSENYWINRYAMGGNSGDGSRGVLSTHKAAVINEFIILYEVKSVIDFGCGDGCLPLVEVDYIGFDVSEYALEIARQRSYNLNKAFYLMSDYSGERAELALSLDVLYHLIEDEVYHDYLQRLFYASEKYVIIYSSNFEARQLRHERRREFVPFIRKNFSEWVLAAYIKNRYHMLTYSDFYIYERG